MKDNISFYPKKYLIILLSSVISIIANILATIMEKGDNPEKCLAEIDILLGDDAFIVQYATAVKTIMNLVEDKKEMKAIEAEVKLHLDSYSKKYDKATKEFAEMQLADLFTSLGLEGKLNND